MSYRGQTARMPLDLAGFQFSRNTDLLIPTAIVEPTSNVNFHEGGLGKRGGTAQVLDAAITGTPQGRGLYQFVKENGQEFLMFATSSGKVYANTELGILKTGMSTSNYFHFATFDDEVYICDGATVPQVWDGVAANTSSITGVATDWATLGYPFQAIPHSRGSNRRLWYITKYAVFASENNDGQDASDANVIKIPIYTEGGLVGAVDFGGVLIAFSKTKAYLVDDSDSDTALWGYQEAIWDGGVAHWRLIVKAANNVFLMTEEGLIYSIRGVQATGDYESVPLTRPAHIDRWFAEKVDRSSVEKFHASYDRSQRAINFFVQVSGNNPNTDMKYFIDRPPEIAWIPHDNPDFASGYRASASAPVRVGTGDYKIYTQDFVGQIWKLEQASRSDNSNPYLGRFKTKPTDLNLPKTIKHFSKGYLRIKAAGNFELIVRIWIDGVRKSDVTLSLSGTGATFDDAYFDDPEAVFADDVILPSRFDIDAYGEEIQIEVLNGESGEDFFASELLINFKPCGHRL